MTKSFSQHIWNFIHNRKCIFIFLKILSLANSLIANNNIRNTILEIKNDRSKIVKILIFRSLSWEHFRNVWEFLDINVYFYALFRFVIIWTFFASLTFRILLVLLWLFLTLQNILKCDILATKSENHQLAKRVLQVVSIHVSRKTYW